MTLLDDDDTHPDGFPSGNGFKKNGEKGRGLSQLHLKCEDATIALYEVKRLSSHSRLGMSFTAIILN